MAVREGTRASKEFICVSLAPDFCKSPNIVVPYSIVSKFDCAVNFSTNVRFRKQWVFRHNSRLSTVLGDEPGAGGGVLSGVNKGFCRPIDGTSSKTVRANNSFVDYHEGTYMFMNCAGPDGQFNTIGRVVFLGNMLPGPVAPGSKVPKSCIEGSSSLLADIESQFGDLNDLIGKAKQLYALAQTDWSDPAAVLGAMGGLAGIAGLQDVAELAKKGKELYELGKQVVNADFSDPMQALAALAGVANVAGMKDVAKVAGMANTIGNAIKTDWSDPRAALASATAIMKNTGLNQMVAEMASNAILDSNIPVSQTGTAPPLFPKPGSAGKDAGSAIPPSTENKPRVLITPDAYAELRRTNPIAAARYDSLSSDDKNRAFVEYPKDSKDPTRAAVYVPGDGFSSTQAERDSLPNLSQHVPSGIREVFVASHEDAAKGNVFGIKEKEGNVYLFGGLVDLGSPDMPGAGTSTFWWVPDRILNMDMSPYYDYHDRNYYGDNVTLGDVGKILDHELAAFKAGANGNPLQLPLQMLYSAATTGVGLGTAAFNSVNQAILGSSGDQKPAAPGGLQIDSFSSIGDFFSSAFDSGGIDPKSMVDFFGPGGCMPDSVPTLPGQTVPGGPSGPGAGTKPATGKAGAPEGAASGAGNDGVLITTKQGSSSQSQVQAAGPAGGESDGSTEKRPLNATEREKVEKNINSIENSDFGSTDEGRRVVADLREKLRDGRIVHVERGGPGGAHYDPSTQTINLEDENFSSDVRLAAVLAHEGTHAVDHSQFPGSRANLNNEMRAYENQVAFLRQMNPKDPLVVAYDNCRSREEFGSYIRSHDPQLYGNLPSSRYPGNGTQPKPLPSRSDYPPGQLGDVSYQFDREQHDAALNHNRESMFEQDRSRGFEAGRQRRPTPSPTTKPQSPDNSFDIGHF